MIAETYVDLRGTRYVIAGLDDEERQLIKELREFAEEQNDWAAYSNHYIDRVGKFYTARGLSRREIIQTPVWNIAQDIGGRLHIALGQAAPPSYRGELEWLILSKFGSRREFCKATGLSEDMLSHVLAGRKNFGINTLSEALAKIGYSLHISPVADAT